MSQSALSYAVSIHDVMPQTLPRVAELLALLGHHQIPAIRLLVVPGKNWSADQIKRLHNWQAAGHTLAAHGWHHRASHIRGLRHRLHSVLISRDVAEHLALSGKDIQALMIRSAHWFEYNGLERPQVYVPPAWALGSISTAQLKATGYRHVEVTAGEIDIASGRMTMQPLVGFEADTRLRALSLQAWNLSQIKLAKLSGTTLRIAIHPQDLQLRLGHSLRRIVQCAGRRSASA